jgi:hypothetical protein
MSETVAEYKTDELASPEIPKGWQDQLKLKTPILHKDLVVFETELNRLGGIKFNAASVTGDHAIKAAIEAGWIVEPETKVGDFSKVDQSNGTGRVIKYKEYHYDQWNVDEMIGGMVRWIGNRILERYNTATEIPPN